MQQRTLSRGQTLWHQGEPCDTLAHVEAGKLGVWRDRRLAGVIFPHMVLGESAIAALGGPPTTRAATVVALEDGTTVLEYPATFVRDSFGAGIHRKVLRTLLGQVCRNALLVMAACPGHPVVDASLLSLIRSMSEVEAELGRVGCWEEFQVIFRVLYHLREGSDAMRSDLVPSTGDLSETIVKASTTLRGLFKSGDIVGHVQQFIDAERERTREIDGTIGKRMAAAVV